jgi:preprotein translocase subunit SecG
MTTIIIFFHVLACLALILVVLLQTGKGAQMGAAFGGSSQALFGSTGGATFLGKMTTAAAIVFMLTCLLLSYRMGHKSADSIMKNVEVTEPAAPVLPEANPVQNNLPAALPEHANPDAMAIPSESESDAPGSSLPQEAAHDSEQTATPPAAGSAAPSAPASPADDSSAGTGQQ